MKSESMKNHQMPIEEIHQWLGELVFEVKMRDKIIQAQANEIEKLKAVLNHEAP